MNTKGMIRSSWQKFRNSCGTSHHPRCNVLLAHGGCVPLGFCAEDHGRKLRVVLNPRCNGSALTSTSSVRYGSSTRHSQRPLLARLFSLDNILDGTSLFNCSFIKSMARTSWTHLSIPYLHMFYDTSHACTVVYPTRIREIWSDWILSAVVLLYIPLSTTLLDRAAVHLQDGG